MADPVSVVGASRRRPRWSLSAISIEYKLPLFICALMLAVSAAYSWAAYRNVRVTELTGARARLESITGQLTGMLQGQTRSLIDSMRASPVNSALRAYLADPTAAKRPAALEALAHVGPVRAQVVTTELWSAERVLQLQDARDADTPPPGIEPENVQWQPGPDSGAVGRLQVVGRDSMVYPVSLVLADRGRPLGYVVQWRRILSSARTREQTLQLIGSGASLYIGNDRGEVWMDLLHVAPKPPVDVRGRDSIFEYTRPGIGRVLARARPIPGSAWVVLVEFPQSIILAPLVPVVRRLAIFTALVVVAGLAASWLVGRRIAKPLRDLTDASAAIAAGDYSHPVAVDRDDELGGLAASFNTMLGRVRDSQHALEEQVRHRTAELEERNEELEGFGYSISHDLRAPLRAMQGFSQALLEDSADRLDPMGREYAERIVAGARRMDQLIQDLLAYSRVSRAELRLVPVPLGTVARTVLAELEEPIRSRQAVVRVDDPLPEVLGHPATLTQVLTNLIGNALKFVPAERTPKLRMWAENGAGQVRVWIEDNGIGIAGEHRERIFRVFERLHSGEEYPGTGIGLAIVRKAVERMGGRVGVESTAGQGSRFWVELQRVDGGGARA